MTHSASTVEAWIATPTERETTTISPTSDLAVTTNTASSTSTPRCSARTSQPSWT